MKQQLIDIIDGEKIPSYSEVESMIKEWPACVIPAVAALKNPSLSQVEQEALHRRIALAIGDRRVVMRLLGADGQRFDNFYPDPRHNSPSTVATIDEFLTKFRAPVSPIAFGEGAIPVDLPYNFDDSNKNENLAESDPINEEEEIFEPENIEITEEMALNMIKNRNYEAALQIIQTLNLTNPEKSVYFADQIRFLKKLIINENNIK